MDPSIKLPVSGVPLAQKPLFRLSLFSYEAIPNSVSKITTRLSQPQKIILLSLGAGVILVGLVARYLKRRRRPYRKSALAKSNDPYKHRKNKPITIKSPTSGELNALGGSVSPGFHRSGYQRSSVSAASDRISVASVISARGGDSGSLAPQQYGVMGMEALESAVNLWEEALASYVAGGSQIPALPSSEAAEFTQLLQKVIEDAYSLQDHCEHLFLHQHSVLFRSQAGTPEPSDMVVGDAFERRTYTSLSSLESFVSAQGDIADLRDLEEFEEHPPDLYIAALKHHEEHGIPYRDVRTEWVRCGSDVEYVCKVHCLRLASHVIFSQPANKEWFAEAGRQVIQGILLRGDKDPKEAIVAYDDLLAFLTECDWLEVEIELKNRGVAATTFYDVVLDFILMDSFEDLDNPPSSVLAVVQNRWLSNGFKESALATAVWSVLKAKRRMLKCQDGFIAHFYDVMEHLSPVFAWGFLGPDHRLRDVCEFFREQVQGLLQDMFNFTAVRYTSVDELSEDLLKLTHERFEILMNRISQPPANGVIGTLSS